VTELTDKVERSIARFERVTRQIDQRDGPTRAAASRERQRLNAGLGRTLVRIAAVVAAIWMATLLIGLVQPIGVLGFAAALLATAVVAIVLIARGGRQIAATPAPSADLPNGAMVEGFDSYVYRARRALPAPAQMQLDAISQILPSLKETLSRIETLDPAAQDARRLMSIHLPGLIDRYQRVPSAYRQETDGEGKTVDQRLVEGLAAGRAALAEVAEQLARADVAALETQGRFIESRYGRAGPSGDPASASAVTDASPETPTP
jgi:hypothetical protein